MDITARLVIGAANILTALLVIMLAIPLVRGRIAPNRLYGIRLKRTFASGEAWYAINRWGGIELVRWSFAVAAIGVVVLAMPSAVATWKQIGLSAAPLLYLIGCWRIYRFAQAWDRHSRD